MKVNKKHSKSYHQANADYDDEDASSDNPSMAGEDFSDVESIDSEEQALNKARKRDSQNKSDPKNKLKLGEFHRNNISKKKRGSPPLKKQIRDLERMISREGCPEEIKQAKTAQLKDLKK